jgi:hypothetical protein
MSHHCIYFSKTLVMEEIKKVKNGEDFDSSISPHSQNCSLGFNIF